MHIVTYRTRKNKAGVVLLMFGCVMGVLSDNRAKPRDTGRDM